MGENVHINCAAVSIPEAKEVYWRYHGETIDDGKLTCFGTQFFFAINETTLTCDYMLTLESRRFPVLDEVSFSTRTLPHCLRNGAKSYYYIVYYLRQCYK